MSLFSAQRWWYSPRSDKKLNLPAFLLICLASTLSFYLLLRWPLPRAASALPSLYRSAALTQWLTPPPATLPGWDYGVPSPTQRAVEEMVDEIKNGTGSADAPLVNASGHADKPLCSPAGTMFDGVAVYPGCAALSFPLGAGGTPLLPDDNEIRAFRNFAAVITRKFMEEPNNKNNKEGRYRTQDGSYAHSEEILANALLAPDYRSKLEIPWVYMADTDGRIAVFPGNAIIDSVAKSKTPGFETTSRPWYRAAFGDEPSLKLALGDGKVLTTAYSDVLVQKPILVRTYLYPFEYNGKRLVIGVDLHLPDEQDPSGMPWLARNLYSVSILSDTNKIALSFVLSVIVLGLFGWMSFEADGVFVFQRLGEAYGKVSPILVSEFTSKWSKSQTAAASFRLDQTFGAFFERKSVIDQSGSKKLGFDRKLGDFWGVELWGLSRARMISWQFLWFRFEIVIRHDCGRILLLFTEGIVPRAEWLHFKESAFPEQKRDEVKARLRRAVELNGVSAKSGRFEMGEDRWSSPFFTDEGYFPRTLFPAVVNREELDALRYGRAYLTLSDARLDQLYTNAEVWAVILPNYLENLLESAQTQFLLRGSTIDRLVCFPSETAALRLSSKGCEEYKKLLEAYSVESRYLRRVDGPLSGVSSSGPQPVYDFAILNGSRPEESLVVVAQSAMETWGIDPGLSGLGSHSYRVRGYVSWRPADRAFFREVWEEISKNHKAMSVCSAGQDGNLASVGAGAVQGQS